MTLAEKELFNITYVNNKKWGDFDKKSTSEFDINIPKNHSTTCKNGKIRGFILKNLCYTMRFY